MRGNNKLPTVHFGAPAKKSPWKKSGVATDDRDDDKLRKTPASVRRMLGFDPAANKMNRGKRK